VGKLFDTPEKFANETQLYRLIITAVFQNSFMAHTVRGPKSTFVPDSLPNESICTIFGLHSEIQKHKSSLYAKLQH